MEGPRHGKVAWTCTLPAHVTEDAARFCGLALGEDGALRVVSGGRLYAVSPSGTILWRDAEPSFAPPVCLRGGSTLASCRGRFRVLDAFGQPGEEIAYASAPDDSNVAPNLSGETLLSAGPAGDVHRHEDGRFVRVGCFGYDTLQPAVFEDGTLAVSGYGGVGYCRVALDGRILWRTDLEADLLPVIASDQRSAVGSLGDECSHLYDPNGVLLGTHPEAAIFSEHTRGWVTLSERALGLLAPDGTPLWRRAMAHSRGWGGLQAIVDGRGAIYAPSEEGLSCFDSDGKLLATARLPCAPMALAPVGPGRMAVLCGDELSVLS